jgi:hypothetical protein
MYPIPPAPRTAVLSAVFRSSGAIRVFPDFSGISAFEPEAMAGTLAQIESLAGVVKLTHALVLLRSESEPGLTEAGHDRLWRAFRVPVFEQIIASDGRLLAWECEAHTGLHIESHFSAGDREIDRTPCGCGRSTPRLMNPAGVRVRGASTG